LGITRWRRAFRPEATIPRSEIVEVTELFTGIACGVLPLESRTDGVKVCRLPPHHNALQLGIDSCTQFGRVRNLFLLTMIMTRSRPRPIFEKFHFPSHSHTKPLVIPKPLAPLPTPPHSFPPLTNPHNMSSSPFPLPRPQSITFITSNPHKLSEVRATLGDTVDLTSQSLDLVEIQGGIEEIAREKCGRAAQLVSGSLSC
jgi:Ham1 family